MELEEKDFRIGNYLLDRKDNLCMVEQIGGDREFYAPAIRSGTTHLPNKPIVLNEDWMPRLGFIYDENKGFEYKDEESGEIRKIEDRPLWYLPYNDGKFNMRFCWYPDYKSANNCPCEFLHELQNAFYASTKTELILK